MKNRPPRAWQRMLSGRRLDLLAPDPADIAIEDIAHGLARVGRWNGQTGGPHIFSVAQHSLLVEALFADAWRPEPRHALAALLHDAAEYVMGDLISPLKAALDGSYVEIERAVLAAVHTQFGIGPLPIEVQARIKSADRDAARLEASSLAGFAEAEATLFFGTPREDVQRWIPHLAPQPAGDVQARLLERFAAILRESGA